MLCDKGLSEQASETVLPEALHSVRSLLCTATNATSHERFLLFDQRSMLGRSLAELADPARTCGVAKICSKQK